VCGDGDVAVVVVHVLWAVCGCGRWSVRLSDGMVVVGVDRWSVAHTACSTHCMDSIVCPPTNSISR
jgi:hypothetical protein